MKGDVQVFRGTLRVAGDHCHASQWQRSKRGTFLSLPKGSASFAGFAAAEDYVQGVLKTKSGEIISVCGVRGRLKIHVIQFVP
jgi:hypothetical protein